MRSILAALSLFLLSSAAQAKEAYRPPIFNVTMPFEVRIAPPEGSLDGLSIQNAPVSLKEAVAIGLTHHENIAIAKAEVAQAMARVAQARASTRPDISATGSYTHPLHFKSTGGFNDLSLPGGGDAGSSFALFSQATRGPQWGLEVRQLLFDFNRTRSAIRAADARTRASIAGVARAQQELGYEIARAFLKFLQSRRLAEVRLQNAENQSIHVEEAKRLHATGLGLPIDVVRAQTQYATAVYDFVEARNRALMDRIELATFMGLDPRTPFVLAEPEAKSSEEFDLDTLVERALRDRPAITESTAGIEAQKFTLDNVRAANKPRFSTSLGYQSSRMTLQPQTDQVNLMLNLEWPIFNGGLSQAQVQEAQTALTTVEAQLSLLQRQIVAEVTLAYVKLTTAEQSISTARIAVKGALESVRVATGRYRLGLAGFIEVLDSEKALLTAQTDLVNAQSNMEQAQADLRLATGQPWN